MIAYKTGIELESSVEGTLCTFRIDHKPLVVERTVWHRKIRHSTSVFADIGRGGYTMIKIANTKLTKHDLTFERRSDILLV